MHVHDVKVSWKKDGSYFDSMYKECGSASRSLLLLLLSIHTQAVTKDCCLGKKRLEVTVNLKYRISHLSSYWNIVSFNPSETITNYLILNFFPGGLTLGEKKKELKQKKHFLFLFSQLKFWNDRSFFSLILYCFPTTYRFYIHYVLHIF